MMAMFINILILSVMSLSRILSISNGEKVIIACPEILLFRVFAVFRISFIMVFALNAQNITNVDITQARFGIKNAEEIFKDFEIVPLETHKNGLLKVDIATYYVTDKYIIGMNFTGPAYLFDRKTGSFIRQISSRGRGPDEYNGPFFNQYGFDEKNNIIFVGQGLHAWKSINIETNKVELIINKPKDEGNNEIFGTARVPWFLKDGMYVSFCNNKTGIDKTKLIVFDNKGNLIKKYPNHLEYNTTGMTSMSSFPDLPGIFYYYNGNTYFKECNYNDTVFRVSEKEMLPHIVFKLGNRQPSYYHQRNVDFNKGKYLIDFVYETNSFILFNFTHHTETVEVLGERGFKRGTVHSGYYNKKSGQVFISSTSDLKSSGYTLSGIPVSFIPISINKNNEMIARIDAADLVENMNKIGAQYRQKFRNIHEEDNPIVVIAKLK